MRIGENLSPFWQKTVAVLWVLGYGLTFVAAVSTLWGWHVVGWVSCGVLVASAIDERKGIRAALTGNARKTDRLFAAYLLAIASIATVVNAVLAVIWLLTPSA